MRKFLIAAAMLLALVGCGQPAESAKQVNTSFKVETLFTHEGCTVYRFADGGYKYYSNCGAVKWRESCGKACTKDVEVLGGKHD